MHASGARLRGRAEFDRVFKGGQTTLTRLLILRYRPNGSQASRWGFAVGRRLDRRAVVRNRLRRRLRAIARDLQVSPAGIDLVVVARPAALEAGYAELRKALEAAAKKAFQGAGTCSQKA
jgi:ribonuclease P protein component